MQDIFKKKIKTNNIISNLISNLSGVGPKMEANLNKVGIYTTEDLLFWLPRTYEDRTKLVELNTLKIGESSLCEGRIIKIQQNIVGKKILRVWVESLENKNIVLLCVFFHVYSNQVREFKIGKILRCYGRVSGFLNRLQMVHPEYELFNDIKSANGFLKKSFDPVYPNISGLSQYQIRKIMSQALNLLEKKHINVLEIIDSGLCKKFDLLSSFDALLTIHRPDVNQDIEMLKSHQHPAQIRFALEEWLSYYISLAKSKGNNLKYKAFEINQNKSQNLFDTVIKKLPFSLTIAQKKVLEEVRSDLAKNTPMMRLVQGDVGCGKTLVALLSMLDIISSGAQAVLLAPTEILAKQHAQNFNNLLSDLDINISVLLGKMKAAEKKDVYSKIKSGESNIIIGTHAVFQSKLIYNKLGLVIIDEQHRFGVKQREDLLKKGTCEYNGDTYRPHQLVMTATPIPRTLAMSLYADCDYSVIDQMPANRLPINTIVMSDKSREKLIDRVRVQLQVGVQAYWVCPLIDPSEAIQAQAVSQMHKVLLRAFPEFKIGMIHGQMSSEEKSELMADFKNNKTQVLVATTVIEVGVDVPNANLIIIENAQRMGLAQLHQLRGRVGRGKSQGFCVLLYNSNLTDTGFKRLDCVRRSSDGFKLSEFDLDIRGPGSLLGTDQSGYMRFKSAINAAFIIKYGDICKDISDNICKNKANNTDYYQDVISVLKSRWF